MSLQTPYFSFIDSEWENYERRSGRNIRLLSLYLKDLRIKKNTTNNSSNTLILLNHLICGRIIFGDIWFLELWSCSFQFFFPESQETNRYNSLSLSLFFRFEVSEELQNSYSVNLHLIQIWIFQCKVCFNSSDILLYMYIISYRYPFNCSQMYESLQKTEISDKRNISDKHMIAKYTKGKKKMLVIY